MKSAPPSHFPRLTPLYTRITYERSIISETIELCDIASSIRQMIACGDSVMDLLSLFLENFAYYISFYTMKDCPLKLAIFSNDFVPTPDLDIRIIDIVALCHDINLDFIFTPKFYLNAFKAIHSVNGKNYLLHLYSVYVGGNSYAKDMLLASGAVPWLCELYSSPYFQNEIFSLFKAVLMTSSPACNLSCILHTIKSSVSISQSISKFTLCLLLYSILLPSVPRQIVLDDLNRKALISSFPSLTSECKSVALQVFDALVELGDKLTIEYLDLQMISVHIPNDSMVTVPFFNLCSRIAVHYPSIIIDSFANGFATPILSLIPNSAFETKEACFDFFSLIIRLGDEQIALALVSGGFIELAAEALESDSLTSIILISVASVIALAPVALPERLTDHLSLIATAADKDDRCIIDFILSSQKVESQMSKSGYL